MSEADQQVKIAVLENEVRNLKSAIELQAKEYERRLSDLNHAHAQATVDKSKFVSGELFYAKLDEVAKWRSEMEKWQSKVIGIAIGLGSAAGGIAGIIASFIARAAK
jgi:hypothetical protein